MVGPELPHYRSRFGGTRPGSLSQLPVLSSKATSRLPRDGWLVNLIPFDAGCRPTVDG